MPIIENYYINRAHVFFSKDSFLRNSSPKKIAAFIENYAVKNGDASIGAKLYILDFVVPAMENKDTPAIQKLYEAFLKMKNIAVKDKIVTLLKDFAFHRIRKTLGYIEKLENEVAKHNRQQNIFPRVYTPMHKTMPVGQVMNFVTQSAIMFYNKCAQSIGKPLLYIEINNEKNIYDMFFNWKNIPPK